MKTTRRQELRTNELSEQLDLLGEYLRRNATALTIGAVAVLAVGAGGYWYYTRQTSRSSEAWAQLKPDPAAGTLAMLDRYRSVAAQQISPALTRAAWLEAGHLALSRLGVGDSSPSPTDGSVSPPPPDDPDPEVLAEIAEESFTNVVTSAGGDFTALGRAMIGLGVLAEDRWDTAKAREWYQKVLDEKRLAGTPFQTEARFRLEHIDHWSGKIVFSDAPPASAAAEPAAGKLVPIDPSELPASFQNLPAELSATRQTPAPSGSGVAAQSKPSSTPIKLEPIDPANLRSDDTQLPPELRSRMGDEPAAPAATTQPAESDSGSPDQ